MATLRLFYNTVNSIPVSTDPVHYRSLTVDFADDREVKIVREPTTLLNRTVVNDIFGLRRKLRAFLRTTDSKANVDFLTSFLNAPYKWALLPDAGCYFNLGTVASPVAVPVVFEDDNAEISVPGILKDGLQLITSDIYQRPAALTTSDFSLSGGADTITVTCTAMKLKMKVFVAPTSGGTLAYKGESSASPFLVSETGGGVTRYVKITVVTIGGESELSAERSVFVV